jgi:predicted small secreted protein
MSLTPKIILITCLSISLLACSTIEGIGKDLKKGGQVIQDAANS